MQALPLAAEPFTDDNIVAADASPVARVAGIPELLRLIASWCPSGSRTLLNLCLMSRDSYSSVLPVLMETVTPDFRTEEQFEAFLGDSQGTNRHGLVRGLDALCVREPYKLSAMIPLCRNLRTLTLDSGALSDELVALISEVAGELDELVLVVWAWPGETFDLLRGMRRVSRLEFRCASRGIRVPENAALPEVLESFDIVDLSENWIRFSWEGFGILLRLIDGCSSLKDWGLWFEVTAEDLEPFPAATSKLRRVTVSALYAMDLLKLPGLDPLVIHVSGYLPDEHKEEVFRAIGELKSLVNVIVATDEVADLVSLVESCLRLPDIQEMNIIYHGTELLRKSKVQPRLRELLGRPHSRVTIRVFGLLQDDFAELDAWKAMPRVTIDT